MELLVRVTDKLPADHPRHHEATHAGDVIAWHEDGADWGREELRHPDWRIVKVPGLTEAEAVALTGPEIPVGPAHQQLLRKRGLRLDVGALHEAAGLLGVRRHRTAASFAPEELTKGENHDCVIPLEHVREHRHLKAPVPHPDHLGPLGEVIGAH